MTLNEKFQATALQEARQLLSSLGGLTAVVIATADGFDVASAIKDDIDPSRIAAMASSISAISDVVSHEARLGRGTSVIINTESGFAVLHSVHRPDETLVINVIADETAVLGQVTYFVARFARTLSVA